MPITGSGPRASRAAFRAVAVAARATRGSNSRSSVKCWYWRRKALNPEFQSSLPIATTSSVLSPLPVAKVGTHSRCLPPSSS